MPLIRRIPKRGFNNKAFGTTYLPVNLTSLNLFEEGAVVDSAALKAAGIAKGTSDGVKILGTGELTKKLTVRASAFSAAAKAAIEKLGGTAEVVS
jgi:large subunit ribosomal protein L15